MWKFIKKCFKIYLWFLALCFLLVAILLMQTDEFESKVEDKVGYQNPLKTIQQMHEMEKEILEQNRQALEILKNN